MVNDWQVLKQWAFGFTIRSTTHSFQSTETAKAFVLKLLNRTSETSVCDHGGYVHLLYSVRCSEESAYLLTYQHTSRNHSRMDQIFFFHFFPLTLSPFCTIWLFLSHLSLSLTLSLTLTPIVVLPSHSLVSVALLGLLCWKDTAASVQLKSQRRAHGPGLRSQKS